MTNKKDEKKQDLKTVPLNRQYGHRVIFKAMGFTSEELSLPRIAVVNSWSEQSPGHIHLRASIGRRKGGHTDGGCNALRDQCDRSVHRAGKPVSTRRSYDLPQREAILASIESALHVGWCDGWVGIGSCDKIIPGMLLAAIAVEPALHLHRRRSDAPLRIRRGEVSASWKGRRSLSRELQ